MNFRYTWSIVGMWQFTLKFVILAHEKLFLKFEGTLYRGQRLARHPILAYVTEIVL